MWGVDKCKQKYSPALGRGGNLTTTKTPRTKNSVCSNKTSISIHIVSNVYDHSLISIIFHSLSLSLHLFLLHLFLAHLFLLLRLLYVPSTCFLGSFVFRCFHMIIRLCWKWNLRGLLWCMNLCIKQRCFKQFECELHGKHENSII